MGDGTGDERVMKRVSFCLVSSLSHIAYTCTDTGLSLRKRVSFDDALSLI